MLDEIRRLKFEYELLIREAEELMIRTRGQINWLVFGGADEQADNGDQPIEFTAGSVVVWVKGCGFSRSVPAARVEVWTSSDQFVGYAITSDLSGPIPTQGRCLIPAFPIGFYLKIIKDRFNTLIVPIVEDPEEATSITVTLTPAADYFCWTPMPTWRPWSKHLLMDLPDQSIDLFYPTFFPQFGVSVETLSVDFYDPPILIGGCSCTCYDNPVGGPGSAGTATVAGGPQAPGATNLFFITPGSASIRAGGYRWPIEVFGDISQRIRVFTFTFPAGCNDILLGGAIPLNAVDVDSTPMSAQWLVDWPFLWPGGVQIITVTEVLP